MKKGTSLIEILVILSIGVILASLLVSVLVAAVRKDRAAAAKKAGTKQKEEPAKPKNDNWWENQK